MQVMIYQKVFGNILPSFDILADGYHNHLMEWIKYNDSGDSFYIITRGTIIYECVLIFYYKMK